MRRRAWRQCRNWFGGTQALLRFFRSAFPHSFLLTRNLLQHIQTTAPMLCWDCDEIPSGSRPMQTLPTKLIQLFLFGGLQSFGSKDHVLAHVTGRHEEEPSFCLMRPVGLFHSQFLPNPRWQPLTTTSPKAGWCDRWASLNSSLPNFDRGNFGRCPERLRRCYVARLAKIVILQSDEVLQILSGSEIALLTLQLIGRL